MADKIFTRSGANRGAIDLDLTVFRDNGDGSFDESVAADMMVWDTGTLAWRKATSADLRSASQETSTIYSGTTALTPLFAFANIAASATDSSLVAAVASAKIRVVAALVVTGATATNVTFNTKPGGAGTAISMLFANAANGGAVLPFNPVGWFQTSAGEGLTATTGSGSTTGIQIVYVTV